MIAPVQAIKKQVADLAIGLRFADLSEREWFKIKARKPIERSGLVFAAKEWYPDAKSETFAALRAAGVVAVEFSPYCDERIRQAVALHFADGSVKTRPIVAMLFRAASSMSNMDPGILIDRGFRHWLSDNNLLIADRGDGSWGIAQRADESAGPLPHPETLMLAEGLVAPRIERESASPWWTLLSEALASELPEPKAALAAAPTPEWMALAAKGPAIGEAAGLSAQAALLPERIRGHATARFESEALALQIRQSAANGPGPAGAQDPAVLAKPKRI